MEEYEAKIHRLMLETIDKHCMVQIDQTAKFQVCTNIKLQPNILSFE